MEKKPYQLPICAIISLPQSDVIRTSAASGDSQQKETELWGPLE